MTKLPTLGLIAAMFVGGSAYAASPPATASRYAVAGRLQPAPPMPGRFRLDAELTPALMPARGKQVDPIKSAVDATNTSPRFTVAAALRTKGSADAASAPCAVNDLFKTSFE